MKSLLANLGLGIALAAMLTGCTLSEVIFREITSITGSGRIVTQQEAFTGFDKVDVGHAFKVDISQGETFSVVIRIDDNLAEYLEVTKQGSTLKIGLKPNRNYNISRATREAEITMPELIGLEVSGASQGTITGFESTKALDLEVSGASSLRGNIEAGDARFDVSGASQVDLSGSAEDVAITASGASQLHLSAFAVADADVEASGASQVTVDVGGRLDADASGASTIYYLGNPTLGRIDTSGASSVKRR